VVLSIGVALEGCQKHWGIIKKGFIFKLIFSGFEWCIRIGDEKWIGNIYFLLLLFEFELLVIDTL
jgi:hypothetical protein